MASNKELAEQAEALAKTLGIEAKTQGLGNQALQALVNDLTAKTSAAAVPAPGATDESTPEPTPDPPKPPEHKPFDGAGDNGSGGAPPEPTPDPPLVHAFQVAPGKSLSTLRGILKPGEEVDAATFSVDPKAGQATLEELLEKGYLLKGKPREPSRAS